MALLEATNSALVGTASTLQVSGGLVLTPQQTKKWAEQLLNQRKLSDV